ncbi:LysR family transcriptional regulator [Xaviernesmea oryzae]|uniref:LysR family transcriptional regulator n=1 Tax=Xaviernesmea oryzae TaxID=464029 RepID=UPI0009502BE2|nr:LysR family transcriptional regulator [Xaviernesmea oryzae]
MVGIQFSAITHKHMLYAVAAVEAGSFRQAAVRLHVRESTISRKIRDLEAAIGASIFIRLRSGVELTDAGAIFVSLARKALTSFDAALRMQISESGFKFKMVEANCILLDGNWIIARAP